ncbi:MAG TPA: phosphatidylglycerol lysyltransferase domain-containing protein [Acidimicrobiales bacterium]|nr:phosphatidylglycerol lysyltransferase domain-containing protein [Acidimicrobiales bacterium]
MSIVRDVVQVDVPAGGRVVVASDIHLAPTPTSASAAAAVELTAILDAWVGPGLVVFAGDLFELLADGIVDPAPALAAHPRLRDAVAGFAAEPDRRVVCLVGNHDGRLAWDGAAAATVAAGLGAELALAAELSVDTGRGCRAVRVEHGHRFDPANAFADPRSPHDTPLGQHVVQEVLPTLQGASKEWLEGIEDLSDPVMFPAFMASRVVYRRLAGYVWWLLLPLLAAVVLEVPAVEAALRATGEGSRMAAWPDRLLIWGAGMAAVVAVLGVALAVVANRAWVGISSSLGKRGWAQNDAARADARRLVGQGWAGLITGHTHHAELTMLEGGFYANTGCCTRVVDQIPGRVGLPPVFLPHRQLAWVELEAGADLHVRLLHAQVPQPGGTRLERAVGRRPKLVDARPSVVASVPPGPSWPPQVDHAARLRRSRRIGATAIAAAGLLNLASALTPPLGDRLRAVDALLPLAVPQAAAALVAVAGLGLLLMARGVRRGQRLAWSTSLGLLLASCVLHVVKGVDVEEATAAVVVAAYLLVQRRAFRGPADAPSVRRGLVTLAGGAVAATAFGTTAIELADYGRPRPQFGRAVEAVAERLVGITDVALPHRVGLFLTPALTATGVGLAVFAGWLLFRPVVSRHRSGGGEQERARAIVVRHGEGTLAYFALRHDKAHFFLGESVVAYAVQGGVCLVSPDPIGPRAERAEVWGAFRRFADDHGWPVAVLGASEDWLPVYRGAGMHDLYVGDEAVVDCTRFSLDGGNAKSLRQAVNRVARNGYRVEFYDPSRLDADLQQSLREVMTRSRRGDVERGFSMTLGRVFLPEDRDLLMAVCYSPDGTPAAFCQYVPAPGIDGYSLDLMRRDVQQADGSPHPNGLLDFVVVETIRHLKAQGRRGLGLNFATMRAVVAGEVGDGAVQRAERWFLRRMSDSMQIESLWRFNAKYDPDWAPRYAVYDAPENILPVALAMAKAESFWELPVVGRFFVPPAAEPAELPVS